MSKSNALMSMLTRKIEDDAKPSPVSSNRENTMRSQNAEKLDVLSEEVEVDHKIEPELIERPTSALIKVGSIGTDEKAVSNDKKKKKPKKSKSKKKDKKKKKKRGSSSSSSTSSMSESRSSRSSSRAKSYSRAHTDNLSRPSNQNLTVS